MTDLTHRLKLLVFAISYTLFVILLASNKESETVLSSPEKIENVTKKNNVAIFERWHRCAIERFNFSETIDEFWDSSTVHLDACGLDSNVSLKILPFHNRDEDKMAILPLPGRVNPKIGENVVTIGVGRDIGSELSLQKAAKKLGASANFYGADPIYMLNFPIFSKIGTFFPLAISGSNGYFLANVKIEHGYKDINVFHIDLEYFISELLKIRTIDHLWIDNEWAEYELLPYFYKNGKLDNAAIIICQINIEIHRPSANQKDIYMKFIRRIIEDRRYAVLKQSDFAGHHRIFMFNFENDYCVQKYVPL